MQRRILLALMQSQASERDKDVERKRTVRSESARIIIPDCASPVRRERALADPELFLKTYFAPRYKRPFGKDHYQMMDAILSRAKYGGRQAVAAPRGRGKSELVKGMLVYLVLAGLVRFPLPVGSTTAHAGKIYQNFRKKLNANQLLFEDFPEVCHPIRELDGAPQRSGKQHIDGVLTEIVWTATDFISLPKAPGSPYGGVKMAYYGLDAAFRGVNIDGDRPDFVLIDDPETRESAKMPGQIEDRERIIDQDIAGLAEEGEELAIVVLTTIQNRICLSFRLTDRDPEKGKPAFNGLRFGMIERWPDTVEDPTDETKLGLWSEYITLRKKDQSKGDEYGLNATSFYLDRFEEMNAGAELLASSFTPTVLDDGTQVTHSLLQVQFNKIADTDLDAYRTEYQNDPPDLGEEFGVRLQSHSVAACEEGFDRWWVPESTEMLVTAVDVRKSELHYATLASSKSRKKLIPDYDAKSHGSQEITVEQAEHLIEEGLHGLVSWWDSNPCCDPSGTARSFDLVLIDKGWMGNWKEDGLRKTWATQPVETFCMTLGLRRFLPAKGAPNYKSPAPGENVIVGDNWHMNRGEGAQRSCTEVIWSAEHWHSLVEDLFVTPEDEERFGLFRGLEGVHKGHNRLAQHIRQGSEDLADMRASGTAARKQRYRRDHWWDSLAMCLVAQSIEQWFRDNLKPRPHNPRRPPPRRDATQEIGAR